MRRLRISILAALVAQACTAFVAEANPGGAVVTSGTATFSTQGKTLTVTSAPNSIINWQSFSIASGETTRFQQASPMSAVLNRVVGADASALLGTLQSNGRVFLVNPNGIVFGAGARIDTAGLIASTLNISDQDFLAGRLSFDGGGSGVLRNEGVIQTSGDIYLVGPQIENTGSLRSEAGNILLAAGRSVTITSPDAQGVQFKVQAPGDSALNLGSIDAGSAAAMFAGTLRHSGDIRASRVTLSASGAVILEGDSLVSVDNPDGVGGRIEISGEQISLLDRTHLSANGTEGGGEILIGGGSLEDSTSRTINVASSSTLDANATAAGDGGKIVILASDSTNVQGVLSAKGTDGRTGGFVETSAHTLNLNGIRVDTGGGTWLIDPNNFTVAASGGSITGATLSANLGSSNVTILSSSGTAGSGDININDTVSWSANNLTLTAARDININAVMTASGTSTLTMNTASANGADGAVAGGTVKVGMNGSGFTGRVDFPGRSGAGFLTINGNSYTVINSLGAAGSVTGTDLQGMSGSLAGFYALGSNIDASATSGWNAGAGFNPVGSFTGQFDGLGHTVSNLTINRPTTDSVGLFGSASGAVIRNIGLVSASVIGQDAVGGLVGNNENLGINGTVSNAYVTGSVTGRSTVGGLVGYDYYGAITNSYSTAAVVGTGPIGNNNNVGGLVGASDHGAISNAYATGSVDNSANSNYVGGLVGYNSAGSISDSYATGNVNGAGNTIENIGGLVGSNTGSGSISNAYSTGSVSGYQYVGGLVGYSNGSISNSHSSGVVTAWQYAGGIVGWNEGSIATSYNTGAVSGSGVGNRNIGGVAGYNRATIINSYNTASVVGDQRIGGIAGALDGAGAAITNSYNAGSVTGSANTGGLVGRYWSGTVTDSFWDIDTSGQAASTGGGTGLTTAQMKQQASFTNWDFASVWGIQETESYPYLQNNMQIPYPGCSGICGAGGGGGSGSGGGSSGTGSGSSGGTSTVDSYRGIYAYIAVMPVRIMHDLFMESVSAGGLGSLLPISSEGGHLVCR